MKLVQRQGGRLVFSIANRERIFLERLLTFYPMQPDPRPPLTRDPESRFHLADAEVLLHESLKEQSRDAVEWVKLRFTEGETLVKAKSGWRLTLEESDVERLLQILNEMRVGAWHRLGSPEDLREDSLAASPTQAPFFAIMTLAGQFEIILLQALYGESEGPPETSEPGSADSSEPPSNPP